MVSLTMACEIKKFKPFISFHPVYLKAQPLQVPARSTHTPKVSLSIFAFLLTPLSRRSKQWRAKGYRHQPIAEMFISRRVLQHFDPLVTASMCISTCLGTYKDWKITKDDDNGGAAIADTYITLLPFSTDVNKLHGHAWCFYKEFVAFTRMKKLRIHDSDHELAGHPRQMY